MKKDWLDPEKRKLASECMKGNKNPNFGIRKNNEQRHLESIIRKNETRKN